MLPMRVFLPLSISAALLIASCAPAVRPAQSVAPAPSSEQPNQSNEASTYAAVEKLSLDVQSLIAACAEKDNANIRSCIGDALDAYAAGLAKLRDKLPPQLADTPDVVATAAHRVRAAKTKAQAAQAMKAAIGAVHKTIALLRADDPSTAYASREGKLISDTLQLADGELEKAGGL